MTRVEILDGRAVLVREGGDALRREAEVLDAVAGPGVPVVAALDDDGTTVRLVTVVEPPLPFVGIDVPALVAEVATVLARAHAAGIVHGPLRDEQLFGRPGGVVVGGWHEAGPGDPAADVAELGRLVERLAGDDASLRALAARALAPGRPTMAALAAAPPAPPSVPKRPSLPVVGLVVAAVVVGVGLLVGGGRPAPSPPPAAAVTTSSPVTTSTTTTMTTRPSPADRRIAVTGNVVERDGERWTVGHPGDVVVVGDWTCAGEPVPALLRPATGQVWTFGAWLDDGAPAAGRLVATVDGGVDLEVERAGSCDRLRVIDAQGRATTVG